jgi:hypothetical protein
MRPAVHHAPHPGTAPQSPAHPRQARTPGMACPPCWPPQTPTPCRTAPGDRSPASRTENPQSPRTPQCYAPHPDTPAPAVADEPRSRPYQPAYHRPESPQIPLQPRTTDLSVTAAALKCDSKTLVPVTPQHTVSQHPAVGMIIPSSVKCLRRGDVWVPNQSPTAVTSSIAGWWSSGIIADVVL